MSLGSGENLSDLNTRPGNLSATTFVPRTDTYEDENTEVIKSSPQDRSIVNSKKRDSLATATASNNADHSLSSASQNVTTNPAPVVNLITSRITVATESIGGEATTPDLPNSDVVVIIGATCGGIGLIIGMIITAIVWVYYTKRKNQWAHRNRSVSTLERNPKEKTFEPLDMSLTLPSYGHASASQKRESFTGIPSNDSNPELASRFDERHNNHSYHGFDPPSPPQANLPHYRMSFLPGSNLRESENRNPIHMLHGNRSLQDLPNVGPARDETNEKLAIGKMKRPTSISTRDSFSSGLGTGTESDFLPSESQRNIRSSSSYNSDQDSLQMQFQLPSSNVSSYKRNESKRRSQNSVLGVVRENASRNYVAKFPIRSDQKSDTSGSRGSSVTPSTNEWSSTDTSYSPSSTIPSTIGTFPAPHHPTPPSITEEDKIQNPSKWSSNDSTDDEAVWDKNDDTGEDDNMVSSYFNMHFPSSPLQTANSAIKERPPASTLPPVKEFRPDSLIRRDSDVIINL